MKRPVRILSVSLFLLLSFCAAAQDPVIWSFTAKKTGDKIYEVRLAAEVEEPWHIYSQHTPAGGALPTIIKFTKNPLVIAQGGAKENGKLVKKFEKVFDTEVKYFEGNVVFVQMVKLSAKAKT